MLQYCSRKSRDREGKLMTAHPTKTFGPQAIPRNRGGRQQGEDGSLEPEAVASTPPKMPGEDTNALRPMKNHP